MRYPVMIILRRAADALGESGYWDEAKEGWTDPMRGTEDINRILILNPEFGLQ